jgi:hypothetical protein
MFDAFLSGRLRMALFQRHPEAKVASDLKAACTKRDNLAERLKTAEATVVERRNAAIVRMGSR